MNTSVERLIKAFKDKNLWGVRGLNADIARKTGFTRSYVGQVFKGTKDPADKFVMAVCSAFGIRREWIEHGEEPVLEQKKRSAMYIGKTDPEILKRIAQSIADTTLDSEQQMTTEDVENTEDMQDKITREMFAPLLEDINDRQAIIALVKTLKGAQLKIALKFITELVSKQLP